MSTVLEIKLVAKPSADAFMFGPDSYLSKTFNVTREKSIECVEEQYYRWFWDRVNSDYSCIMVALNKLEDELVEKKVLKLHCTYRARTVRDYLLFSVRQKGHVVKE